MSLHMRRWGMFLAVSIGMVGLSHGQGWAVPKPSTGLMPNAAAGKHLFAKHCAACHGTNLKGSDKGPPLLHKIYEPSHHADAAFQLAAANGVRAHHWQFGDMPAVDEITDLELDTIIVYVRELQRANGIN